ncbi:hypothetical protein LUZ60_009889 [Juncus effusus]|nr:hypothetical protein LUZ60_009889 [Juncus effusus]
MKDKMRKQFCTYKHRKQDLRSHPNRSGLQCLHGKSLTHRRPFSEAEEDLFFKLHSLLGNRWGLIAGRLPNRTENEIKNYWNSYLKTKRSKIFTTKQIRKQRSSLNLIKTQDGQADQVSDAASGLDGDVTMTRDVNLDLSISVNSSPLLNVEKKMIKENTCNKTLLLFH